jgi:hypothetical protein
MSAALKISDDLLASVHRMRARPWLDATAAAFEVGGIDTWAATQQRNGGHGQAPAGSPVDCVLVDRRRPLSLLRRRPQSSPDRQKSYERRHRLAFSGPMPGHLAAKFTVSQMAVFRVVGDEHRGRGRCDMTLDEIAARAGCCRKSAQRAIHAARDERLITIEERRPKGQRKHLPNVVRIISPEWLAWLAHGRLKAMKTGHSCPTTVNILTDDSVGETKKSGLPIEGKAGQPSAEAITFSVELASIAGHRLKALPQAWVDAKPERVVQVWLDHLRPLGMGVETLRTLTAAVMRRKLYGPPHSPRYFSHEVRKLRDDCLRPVPRPQTRMAA